MIEEKNKKVAAYVVEDESTAQYRYRVKNVQEALEAYGKEWKVMVYRKSELINLVLGEIDLLVILRQTSKDDLVPGYVMEARDMGIPVAMDLDDLIFSYADLPGLMRATGSRNVLYWTGYVWGIRRIATKVNGFIATNEFLGEKLTKCFSQPHTVIRNSLNQKQVKVAEKCLPKKPHKGFMVGYFSGSPTHAKDFQMVEDELIRFLTSHEDATLVVVGYMKFSEKMQKLLMVGKVEQRDLVDWEKLQKMMSEVDVNIAPLVINDFTNSKSELKYFEAGVVETVTIASPTYSFARAIKDGGNGYLANSGEWYEKLEHIYEQRKENEKVAERARKDALDNYFGKAIAEEVEKAYNELLKVEEPAEKEE
ncbi:glycosyltransferase [Candidatus Saccharibacteria bacterium]|nr:glycosyltransferase [Candidatus Saccharibacteria bacterium]